MIKKKVCIGGTFNILHIGHKKLIDKAIEILDDDGLLLIGLADGKLLNNKKNVKEYNIRKKNIVKFLEEKKFVKKYEIVRIKDIFGPTLKKDFDVIVVSPETRKNAEKINNKRRKLGRKIMKIIMIPYVLADDDLPISSTRILNNEIDTNGRVILED